MSQIIDVVDLDIDLTDDENNNATENVEEIEVDEEEVIQNELRKILTGIAGIVKQIRFLKLFLKISITVRCVIE